MSNYRCDVICTFAGLVLALCVVAQPQAQTLAEGASSADASLLNTRLRSLRTDRGNRPQASFVGIGDLGSGSDRNDASVDWVQGDNQVRFAFDPLTDTLSTRIQNSAGTFNNDIDNVAQRVANQGFSVTDINIWDIAVFNRNSNNPVDDAGTTVDFRNVTLDSQAIGSFTPAFGTVEFWHVTDYCFADGFVIEGTLTLDGNFSNSQENSKLELLVGVDLAQGNNCPEPADLRLNVDVQGTPTPGGSFSYLLGLSNDGAFPAENSEIFVALDPSLTPTFVPSQCQPDSGGLLCSFGELGSGDSLALPLQVDVASAMQGLVVNSSFNASTTRYESNRDNNVVVVQTVIAEAADVAVDLQDTTDPIFAGGTIMYELSVNNLASAVATAIDLQLSFPGELGNPILSGCDSVNGASCRIDSLAGSASQVVTIQATVSDDAVGSIDTSVQALVGAPQDANLLNNIDFVSTTVLPRADLQISKTDNVDEIGDGEMLTYVITVDNAGPSDVVDALVVDTIPPALQSATWTCVASGGASCANATGAGDIGERVDIPADGQIVFELTGTFVGLNPISNTAAVSSAVSDPVLANNEATDTTDVFVPDPEPTPGPELTSVDSVGAPDAGVIHAGDELIAPVTQLLLGFDQALQTSGGGAADVVAHYQLVAAGPDGVLDSSECGPTIGDDESVTITGATYDEMAQQVTLILDVNPSLAADEYLLLVCAELQSEFGNPGFSDQRFMFGVERENVFANPTFDLDLASWVASGSVGLGSDLGGAATSGAAIANTEGIHSVEQCAPIDITAGAATGGRFEVSGEVELIVEFGAYTDPDCSETALLLDVRGVLLNETSDASELRLFGIGAESEAASVLVRFRAELDAGESVRFDDLVLFGDEDLLRTSFE